jgi:hypothetical protein
MRPRVNQPYRRPISSLNHYGPDTHRQKRPYNPKQYFTKLEQNHFKITLIPNISLCNKILINQNRHQCRHQGHHNANNRMKGQVIVC